MSATAPSWIGVEQRHLAAYAAVARNRSFRAAAEELGYSQPAVSQLVRKLEDLVGTALVVRRSGSGRVRLTPAGTLMLHHAERLLDGFAAARADLAVLTGRPSRIGILAGLGGRMLPPMLRAARAAGDDVEVLELADDTALSRALIRGEIDIAIGGMPHGADRLTVRRVGTDPYILAVPVTSPLGRFDGRPPSELLDRQPLIVCGDDADEIRRIDRELRVRGTSPRWSSKASSIPAALGAVRADAGGAIVPSSAVEPWDTTIVRIPLDGLVSPRCICRYAHRDRRLPDEVHAIVAAGVEALERGLVVAP